MGSLESHVPVADIYEGLGQYRLSCLRAAQFHTVFCDWYIKHWRPKTFSTLQGAEDSRCGLCFRDWTSHLGVKLQHCSHQQHLFRLAVIKGTLPGFEKWS